MSQSQGKSLRLSTQKKLCLQGEVQCVCWSILSCCVDLQPQIVCPSRQALRLLWQLGVLLKILPPWSGVCLILWRKRRGGKGIEEVFMSCLWFVFSTKSPQSHQSEWFTLLGMNKVSTLLFVFYMVLCALQHHPLDTSYIAKLLILDGSRSFVVSPLLFLVQF